MIVDISAPIYDVLSIDYLIQLASAPSLGKSNIELLSSDIGGFGFLDVDETMHVIFNRNPSMNLLIIDVALLAKTIKLTSL